MHLLASRFAGCPVTVAYVMNDWSGAIDCWIRIDQGMRPTLYAHWRLCGIGRTDDWYMAQDVQFVRYVNSMDAPRSLL